MFIYMLNMDSIFIPQCTCQVCNEKLKTLSVLLDAKGFKLFDTIYAGPRVLHFKQGLKRSSLTILHKCPEIWRFITRNSIDDLLKEKKDLYQKLCCVQFDGVSVSDPRAENISRFQDFFDDLRVQDITTDSALTTCVDNISSLLGNKRKHFEAVISQPDVFAAKSVEDVSFSEPISDEKELFKTLQQIRETHLANYSLEGGLLIPNGSDYATVKVYEIVLECDRKSAELFDFCSLASLEELRNHINEVLKTGATLQSNLKFLKHSVLPAIYEHEMIHGLITLATCNDLDLQKHALNFAERLLLKGKLDSSYTGIEMLLKLKSMLIDSVEIMRCFDPNQEEIIKRKCILLYSLHLDIVLQAKKQQDLGDVNLKIRLEDQTEPIKSFVSSTKTFQSMLFDEAKQFQKDVSSGNVMEETDIYSLVGRKEYKQFYVILQVLKQMFKIQDNGNIDSIVNSFEYLETYLQSKQRLRRRSVSPLCAELILQGILQLLTYISKERCLKQNITALCKKALNTLHSVRRNGPSQKQITRTLRSLVFSPYKELRQHALQFFDGRDDFQKLVELLFLEEVQEYFPVGRLTIHHSLTPSTEQTNYWLSMPGRLKNSKFTACVYIPSRENLIISNKSKFVEKKDLLKRNHIQMLCRLHHPNIATLYAFNMDCMPEFYIQEQHGEEFSENLQQYLVNRSQSNNSLCTTITLIQILLDAVAALKFCHDKDIILRDITAASFIVVHTNVVKLSEFSLAIDLCGKLQIKDKHIDYNQLPTRWSAVESLRWLIWSKQSDVWMFGVLMFEVLTHGLLPYSHLKLKDEDLFRNLTKPSIQLRHEECMSLAHYEVILQCTEKDPMKRPNISQIEESLNELVEKEKTRPTPLWTKYPDLNDPEYKPSTKLRKGIPKTRSSEGLYQFHRSLPDGLKEYTIPNKSKYLFRHKSRRNFPEALLEKINQGLFAAVLPAIEVTVVKQDSQEMGDVFIVDVTVQKHLDGNVLEMVFNKTLGYSARDFRQLLLKIASLIDSLHKLMVVLGSIRASQLYVHRISETDFMIYPVSLAYLHQLEPEKSPTKCDSSSLDHHVCLARSAPEVLKKRQYSVKSDVHQWGLMTLELSEARFSKSSPGGHTGALNFDTLETSFDLSKLQKPKGIKEKLFQLVQKCLCTNKNQRPSMEEIIKMLSCKPGLTKLEEGRFIDQIAYDSNSSAETNFSSALNVANRSQQEDNDVSEDDLDSMLSTNSNSYDEASDSDSSSASDDMIEGHADERDDSGLGDTKVKGSATENESSENYSEIIDEHSENYYSNIGENSSQNTIYDNVDSKVPRNIEPEDSRPEIGIQRCRSLPNPPIARRSAIVRCFNFPVPLAFSPMRAQNDNAINVPSQVRLSFNHIFHLCKEDHYDTAYELYAKHVANTVHAAQNKQDYYFSRTC